MKTKDGKDVESIQPNTENVNSSETAHVPAEVIETKSSSAATMDTKEEENHNIVDVKSPDNSNSSVKNVELVSKLDENIVKDEIENIENVDVQNQKEEPSINKEDDTLKNNSTIEDAENDTIKPVQNHEVKETSSTPDNVDGTTDIIQNDKEKDKQTQEDFNAIAKLPLSPSQITHLPGNEIDVDDQHSIFQDRTSTPIKSALLSTIPQRIHFVQHENETQTEEKTKDKHPDTTIDIPQSNESIDEPDCCVVPKLNGTTGENNMDISQTKNESYDNKAFVNDECISTPKSNDAKPVVDNVKRTDSTTKIPRRVSFSELPPKTVYDGTDNNGKCSEKGDFNSGDGQDMDFLAKYGPGEKWRILRNVVLISSAFMILFTSFFGAANLQSSVNSKAGLGTVSLMILYATLIVSNIFLPVMVIRWLGCKWTVAACMLTFAPYALAQFRAEFYTLIPTALIAGLGGGPMWCAKCTYLNVAADAFSKVTGAAPEVVMMRFFGIFYILFPLGHVWGNLISSEVLSSGNTDFNSNVTVDVTELCGANFCPGIEVSVNPNLQRPPDYKINTIAAMFLACSLFSAVLVAFGVDNLKRYNEGGRKDSGTGLSGMKLLVATARLLCNRNQLLLIPITAFIGVSQAFLGADFTEGYISCAWGIRRIGYVLLCYGLASSIASVLVSWVVKTTGRLVVICSSITLFLVLVIVLKFWQPQPSQEAVLFVLAALWGLADSTALVINAMYGLLFRGNEAAAYSNFSLWGSAGFIITYAYSPHLCMNVKLGLLAVILILSLGGFITVEFALRTILREQRIQERKAKASLKSASLAVCTKPHVS